MPLIYFLLVSINSALVLFPFIFHWLTSSLCWPLSNINYFYQIHHQMLIHLYILLHLFGTSFLSSLSPSQILFFFFILVYVLFPNRQNCSVIYPWFDFAVCVTLLTIRKHERISGENIQWEVEMLINVTSVIFSYSWRKRKIYLKY